MRGSLILQVLSGASHRVQNTLPPCDALHDRRDFCLYKPTYRTSCSRTVSTSFVITVVHVEESRAAGSERQVKTLEVAQFLTLLPGSVCYLSSDTCQSGGASAVTHVLLHEKPVTTCVIT